MFLRQTDIDITILLLYVDDMIITNIDYDRISWLPPCIFLYDLGHLTYFLWIEVHNLAQGIFLTNTNTIKALLL